MNSINNYHRSITVYWQIVVAISVLVGIYARVTGLWLWPLAVDEYFIARSAENILNHGLPQYDCGGYYNRGILMQYLVAAERLMGIPADLAPRMISAVCYLIALPAVFLLGSKTAGRSVAYALLIAFSLSIWEIEFARFGRMYSPFQTLFLWYMVFLYKATIEECSTSRLRMYILSVVGIFLWEGGIFLMALNFIPPKFQIQKLAIRYWLFSGIALLLTYIYSRTDFRLMGVSDHLPTDIIEQLTPNITPTHQGPIVLLLNLFDHTIWAFMALLPFALIVAGITQIVRINQTNSVAKGFLIAILICAITNQFGLVLWLFLLALLYDTHFTVSTIKSKWKLLFSAGVVCFLFWAAFAYSTPVLSNYFHDAGGDALVRKIAVALIKFPNIFDLFVFEWLAAMPILFILISITFFLWYIFSLDLKNSEKNLEKKLILFVTLSLILAVGTVPTAYTTTRYTFFLYPLLLLILISALHRLVSYIPVNKLISNLIFFGIFATSLIISEDWKTGHLLNIDEYPVNFRQIYNDNAIADVYYIRTDIRSPADYINQNMAPGDTVITTVISTESYLDKLDYVYMNYKHPEFSAISCRGGQIERWSNKPLLYREDDILQTIAKASGTSWLILESTYNKPSIENLHNKYKNMMVFSSPDKKYNVYRIPAHTS